MKKYMRILTFFLALCMALCACGKKSEEATPTPAENDAVASTTTSETPEPDDISAQTSAEISQQPTAPTAEPVSYAKVGDYAQNDEFGWVNTVTVESISADHSSLTLSASWTRYTGFDDVTASLNGNVATFDTGVQQAKIEFKKDSLVLTFLTQPRDGLYGFDMGSSQFDYFTQADWDRLSNDYVTAHILSNDDSWGWIHEDVTYVGDDPHLQGSVYSPAYLRFFEDGTLTYWLITPDNALESDVRTYQTTYRIGLDRLFIGETEYKMATDEGAALHLYLTPVNSDPLGLQGHYELGDAGGLYSQLQ